MGAKIPQQSSPRYGAHPAVTTYDESYLKNGARNREGETPILLGTHIQLAGDDLTNDHFLSLLSDLLFADTFYGEYSTAKGFCQQ
jgi:hypothetical protein